MRSVRLGDGTRVRCLRKFEALALDAHAAGYLAHGLSVRAGDVLFDVGANIGIFSLRMLQRCDGVLSVFAIEPIPPIFSVLEANLRGRPATRLELLRCGVGRQRGSASFTYFPRGPALSTAHPELWTADPAQLERAVAGGARHPARGMAFGRLLPPVLYRAVARHLLARPERFACELVTLSDVMAAYRVDRIDLLKLDIEGGELDALEGIAEADWPKVGQVVAEVQDVDGRLGAVVELLGRHGLTEIDTEQEVAFEGTWMHNVYARRFRWRR